MVFTIDDNIDLGGVRGGEDLFARGWRLWLSLRMLSLSLLPLAPYWFKLEPKKLKEQFDPV